MYSKSSLLLLLTLIAFVSCGTGKCPTKSNSTIPVLPMLTGSWYEYASYGDSVTRLFYKCPKLAFTSTEEAVGAKRDYVFKLFNIKGTSQYDIESVQVRSFLMKGKGVTKNLNMWVLDVDYNNYLIFWTCEEFLFGAFHAETSWILTRKRTETLDKNVEEKIKDALKKQSVDYSWYGPVSQNNCN